MGSVDHIQIGLRAQVIWSLDIIHILSPHNLKEMGEWVISLIYFSSLAFLSNVGFLYSHFRLSYKSRRVPIPSQPCLGTNLFKGISGFSQRKKPKNINFVRSFPLVYQLLFRSIFAQSLSSTLNQPATTTTGPPTFLWRASPLFYPHRPSSSLFYPVISIS